MCQGVYFGLMHTPPALFPYVIGLDVGIGSVGWAVLETASFDSVTPIRLRAANSYIFPVAETPKEGISLNQARRLARSTRRRLKRRRQRLAAARLLLIQELGVDVDVFSDPGKVSVWQLRVKALDQPLSPVELAKVCYHLIKHRGFRSSRKESAKAKKDKDQRKLLATLQENQEKLSQYRSFAEMVVTESRLPESPHFNHLRNRAGTYFVTPTRQQVEAELEVILRTQQKLGVAVPPALAERVRQLLFQQKPFATREEIYQKVGCCQFFPEEKRAPLHSVSYELFKCYINLNHLRIIDRQTGAERPLNQEQKQVAMERVSEKPTLSYKQARKLWQLPEREVFKGLYGRTAEEYQKSEEKRYVVQRPVYHQLRGAITAVGAERWGSLSGDTRKLDQICLELTLCKEEKELQPCLQQLGLTPDLVTAVMQVDGHTGFGDLSFRAIESLLPFLATGDDYYTAVSKAGLQPSQEPEDQYFPIINTDELRNPVVLRAVTKARKVVMAIIRRYGPPVRICVEVAREMSQDHERREQKRKENEENRQQNEALTARLRAEYGLVEPSTTDLLKFKLWQEQNAQCAYSGKPISIQMLFHDHQTEVDHALPMSRTLDDSYFNKVLVLTAENQNKRAQTPYEYLSGAAASSAWREYVKRVESWNIHRQKRETLLRQAVPTQLQLEDLRMGNRDLNDTRWMTKFLLDYFRLYCQYSGNVKRRVTAHTGLVTTFFRRRWGVSKSRENDRHHAVDAVVAGCINSHMLERLTRWAKEYEQFPYQERPRFPDPWPKFYKDLRFRILEDKIDEFWQVAELADRYQDIKDEIKPLRVVRAPRRRATGAIHKDTFYSLKKTREAGKLVEKARLEQPKAYQLKNGLTTYSTVEYRPKTAQSYITFFRGEKQAAAENGEMIRIDVFTRDGKFFFVPVYTVDLYRNRLPDRVCVAAKPESEWPKLDPSYTFLFSVYKGDYLRLQKKGKTIEGYYLGANRHTASIIVSNHDRSVVEDGIGLKTQQEVTKYEIDVFGNLSVVKSNTRPTLSARTTKRRL